MNAPAFTRDPAPGTVAEAEAGGWMSVANETMDSMGFRIALRQTTASEGSPAAITPGARVTVWYRSVAERYPVADEVRVLATAVTR